jgi:hypothetical protein
VSDNWLHYVPRDPNWQPAREAAESAASRLREIAPQSDEIECQFHDQIEIIHPYSNWSGVHCPACGADLDDWWHDQLTTAYDGKSWTLQATTPCCGATTSLNDLDFDWPTAFGRFVLVAMNPKLIPTPEQDQAIADRIGSPVRAVWRHL